MFFECAGESSRDQDEATEHKLFVEDVLKMRRQLVQDEAPEHGLFVENK